MQAAAAPELSVIIVTEELVLQEVSYEIHPTTFLLPCLLCFLRGKPSALLSYGEQPASIPRVRLHIAEASYVKDSDSDTTECIVCAINSPML